MNPIYLTTLPILFITLIVIGVILIIIGLSQKQEKSSNLPMVIDEVLDIAENIPKDLISATNFKERRYKTRDGMKIFRKMERFSRGETLRLESEDWEAEIKRSRYELEWQEGRFRKKY